MTHYEILPSLLAADLGRLAEELSRFEEAGARGWHIDVMDGHFVPEITMGRGWVETVRRNTAQFIDVHMMVYDPYRYVETMVAAGADRITFHVEATEDIMDTLMFIRKCGRQAGLAINPETPVELLFPFLNYIDLALIMTVPPGRGGQKFMAEMEDKIVQLASLIAEHQLPATSTPNKPLQIQVDGGIDPFSAKMCRGWGATSFVCGTYLFHHSNPRTALQQIEQGVMSC